MSLGSQIRALTANRARPNNSTIAAGKRVERRNFTGDRTGVSPLWRDRWFREASGLPA